jgi:hypothetical protein
MKQAKAVGIAAGTFLLLAVSIAWMPGLGGDKPTLTVYKSQWCGCCSLWATHMQENGFDVKVIEAEDLLQNGQREARGISNLCVSDFVGRMVTQRYP